MASQSQGGVRGLFAVRGFRRLFAGQAVSGLGDWVATLAFIALAFDITRNQTAVAVVLILRLVPPIFAAPVGGILADRLDRRLVMVTCDLVRAALIVLVPFLGIAGLYAIAFVHECISLVFLSAWMVVRISSIPRTGSAAGEPVFKGLSEAYRYLLRTPILRSLAAGLVVSMFGGGVLFAIGIAYIKTTLHGTDVDFGWLAALWGAGMGIGLGLVRLLVRERGEPWVFLAAVTACGGILITMALLPFLWLAFGISVAFGASFSVAIMVALSMAQRVTEDRIRGRVMGGVQMLFRLGLGVGALGMGALAYWIGRVHFIWITLDGNQVGLLAGGGLILLGAFASSGILRHAREAASASEGTSASPEAGLPSPAS